MSLKQYFGGVYMNPDQKLPRREPLNLQPAKSRPSNTEVKL